MTRRRKVLCGASTLAFVTALSVAYAQSSFADIAGAWDGNTTNDVQLELFIRADGRYVLRFLTGPAGGSVPRGQATWNNGAIVLAYGETEVILTKSPDGNPAGRYATPQGKGVITFSRR